MAGYIELEVTKRDREAYEALHALLRIMVSLVDNADFVATVPDQEPVSFTAACASSSIVLGKLLRPAFSKWSVL